jgi:hypothetical protein
MSAAILRMSNWRSAFSVLSFKRSGVARETPGFAETINRLRQREEALAAREVALCQMLQRHGPPRF